MARFSISREGIESMNELAASLRQANIDVAQSCGTLLNAIEGLEDGIGVFYKDLLFLTRDVLTANKEGGECIEELVHKIAVHVVQMEVIINMSLEGDSSGDDDDNPPVKKLVLKRR